MTVPFRYVLHQGPVLAALGRTALKMATGTRPDDSTFEVPGPLIERTLPPRSQDLVRTFIRVVGGSPSTYRGVLPAHMFPQWGFAPASETLDGIPYPMAKVVNGGCRLEINAPLPADEPLEVSAQLVSVDDNGSRAVMHQEIRTSTRSVRDAVVAHMYPIVPLGKGKSKSRKKRAPARVPQDVREVAFWRIRGDAGLDFAKVTGDFNPIHWIPAYAKAAGFRNTILHGFGTMSRAFEGVQQGMFSGAARVRVFDCKFTRPLVLPARVGLYVADGDTGYDMWVGDAPGGFAYMRGHFEID